MKLCCPGKGCARVIDRPEHKKGFLLAHCPNCKRTTEHFPLPDMPEGQRFLPKAGHRGIFNQYQRR